MVRFERRLEGGWLAAAFGASAVFGRHTSEGGSNTRVVARAHRAGPRKGGARKRNTRRVCILYLRLTVVSLR